MNDLLPQKKPSAQRAILLFILFMPWLSASPALRINNERFKEQLRQVQAYLMSLRQKEILPWTGGLEIYFPFAALISARWAERLGLKAPVSPSLMSFTWACCSGRPDPLAN